MKETVLISIPIEDLQSVIIDCVNVCLNNRQNKVQPTTNEKPDFLSEYVPKSQIRGRLASASTLWKYEKEGKLQAYGVGGKRYYLREDVKKLFTKLNKKGGDHA